MLVMRRREPAIKRPFRVPAVWLVGPGAILGCLYLFVSLPAKTLLWCLLWNAIGIAIYLAYGRHRSLLGKEAPKP
jgi:APA family basic amino acid/polyamine antiporter